MSDDVRTRGRGRPRSRGPLHRGVMRDYTIAEYEAIRAINSKLREIQTTFDRGDHDKACQSLFNLVLSFGVSDRLSSQLRMIEVAQAIRRVRNNFDYPWEKDDPGHFDLVNLEVFTLSDDVLLAILLDPLGYPYRDVYRHAPYVTDGGGYGGEFRPGYDDDDVQIRFRRLQELVSEYGADHNMSPARVKALLDRCYPALDVNDPRLGHYSDI